MNITKFGHSCLLLEKDTTRILVDPGGWSFGYQELQNLDAIFITHEHKDHCDIVGLQKLKEKNSNIKIFTNKDVAKQLHAENINSELFEDGVIQEIKDIKVEAVGKEHAIIYQSSPCANTGFIFDNRIYHPGDSLHVPKKEIEVLALPVCAPWLKLSECIDFAKNVGPQQVFPIHDAMLQYPEPFHRIPKNYLEPENIMFSVFETGTPYSL